MARETRKRTAPACDADDAPAEPRRGSSGAGPSGSARDAKDVKRLKAEKGKAPAVEAIIDLDEEEEDDEFNEQNDADMAQMTQAYQTQVDAFDAQALTTRVSAEERDALVAEVMRLMLFSQYRDGAPVHRADVSKLISSLSQARGLTSWIVAQAQVRFMNIFGYEMKELSRVTAKKTGAARMALDAEPPKVYVLKSALPAAARQRWVDKPEDHAERGFCMTVCALVHMSGGTLLEDRLWQHLEAMGVRREDEAHPKLGDAKAALTRLVKKRYLIREKLRGATNENGGDAYGVTLAERAKDEIGVDGVEKFVAGIMRGAEDGRADAGDEACGDDGAPRDAKDVLDPGSETDGS